ncbi:PIR Superfamily Protein [Plasmodium ovale wallikeri]|uniref:PIR Superfamily Protein n=1 Tax=Plasmodium ovale wallikeri TaxID=864142 RepID=A0A1A9APU6_PLAOA|nr:PIR Superfamily Protein [Plasmodium ovale wallikeri]
MTKAITINDLPSKKYKNELENGINYQDIEKNIEGGRLATYSSYWSTTVRIYLENYINGNIDKWSNSNYEKRCRDFNHILDNILQKIKEKEQTNSDNSYSLIKQYIDNGVEAHLMIWENKCKRNSKIDENSAETENKKKIDDLCEDIDFINKNTSEIDFSKYQEIENHIAQQISELREKYTTSTEKYSHILSYYGFVSFDNFDSILEKLKSKYQEYIESSSLTGDENGISQFSGSHSTILAGLSLSGILSLFMLLYKTTSFGSILNTLVRKKMKFGNSLSNEEYHETLEGISELPDGGAHNILYNSIGDF